MDAKRYFTFLYQTIGHVDLQSRPAPEPESTFAVTFTVICHSPTAGSPGCAPVITTGCGSTCSSTRGEGHSGGHRLTLDVAEICHPLPPQDQADDFHGSPGRGGGGSRSGKLFSADDEGIPGRLMPSCIFNFIFNFCYPLHLQPSPRSQWGIPVSVTRWGWWGMQLFQHSTGTSCSGGDLPFDALSNPHCCCPGNADFRPQRDIPKIPGNVSDAAYPDIPCRARHKLVRKE